MKIHELYQEKPRLENNTTITLKYFIPVHCKKEIFIYIEKQLLIKNNATNISTGKKISSTNLCLVSGHTALTKNNDIRELDSREIKQ